MGNSNINWLAVLVATVASMILGMAWYGIFGDQWMELNHMSKEQAMAGGSLVYVWPTVTSILGAIVMGWLLPKLGPMSLMNGVKYSFIIGIPLVFLAGMTTYAFSMRPMALGLIDHGQNLVHIVLVGAIMGAMPAKRK